MTRQTYCHACGKVTPIGELDGKPEPDDPKWQASLKRHGGDQAKALSDAVWDGGMDFTRLECSACYGPGWEAGA